MVMNIKGYYFPQKGSKITTFERSFRVNMTAELLGFDTFYFNKLKNAIDGK